MSATRLSTTVLAKAMLAAVRGSLAKDWPKARDYAAPELRRLARSLVDIGRLHGEGKITDVEARSLLAVHENTTKTVLLTAEGLGLLAVENALNAALDAVRKTVNAAVGFALL